MFASNASIALSQGVPSDSAFPFRCELNDGFGLILQGILALTAFCILIRKYLASLLYFISILYLFEDFKLYL